MQLQEEFDALCGAYPYKARSTLSKQSLKRKYHEYANGWCSSTCFFSSDQDGNIVSLGDFKLKKYFSTFTQKAMTPGCIVQAEACVISKHNLMTSIFVVLGVSVDPVKRLPNFVAKKSLNFTLLSDEDHSVAEQFGVWGEKKFIGKVYDGLHRISFLIDEEGQIEHVFNKFKTKTHHEVVLETSTKKLNVVQ